MSPFTITLKNGDKHETASNVARINRYGEA